MDNSSLASNALASCNPLSCLSEEHASSLLASQKRRELQPKTRPSQGDVLSRSKLALRPYQSAAVVSLRTVLAWVRRAMLYSPTGSGKTEIMIAIVLLGIASGKRILVLCNRIHLVEQTARRFAKAGILFGVIQGANTRMPSSNVVIASIQTISKRGAADYDLILIDEAHAAAGTKAYRELISAAKCRVIGFSATPFARGLGKVYPELGGPLFEKMVIAATIKELIDLGYLLDCDIYAPSGPDMEGIRQTRNQFGELDYSDQDAERASNTPKLVGDLYTHWRRLSLNRPTVIFGSSIAHCLHILRVFKSHGIAVEHIDHYCDGAERSAILARFDAGVTTVITNVGILCEGWNAPHCSTMILARPTKSLTRYIQMAGRILRPSAGKERGLILDHSGSSELLGYPTDDLPLELDDGKPKDAGAVREREAPLPKACPSCSYVKTSHRCPLCGFAPEIGGRNVEVQAGTLVKVEKKPKATKMAKQDFYSQLLSIADASGYRSGWVSHKYREYFGVWPKGMQDVPMPATATVTGFLKHLQIRAAKSKGGDHAAA